MGRCFLGVRMFCHIDDLPGIEMKMNAAVNEPVEVLWHQANSLLVPELST